jgi:hypothetical protein
MSVGAGAEGPEPDAPLANRPVTDGGENDSDDDRTNEGGSEGGFWPWSGRRRIRRLRRELDAVRSERDDLQSDVERLQSRIVEMETELEELRGTVETVERRTFPVQEFIRQVGESVWIADDELTNTDFGVGDAEVTLRARFAGAEHGLSVQLPDPEEAVDPETLSSVTFRVGRGVSRRGGAAGLMAASPGAEGGIEAGDGLVEVPDVRELSVEGATEELSEAGFEVSVDYRPGATPEGTVIEQDPEPYVLGPAEATVYVVVAGEEPGA